jgi:hypothetical protein
MPITIIVEDGSEVTDANSFVSVQDVRDFAELRGIDLTATDDDGVAAWIINAGDYIAAEEPKFQGDRVTETQSLCFPRVGVKINGFDVASNAIPKHLTSAQCQLVIVQSRGLSLLPDVIATDYIIKEKTDVLETTYADPLAIGLKPTFGAVEALLAPLYGLSPTSGFGLRTQRV